MAQNALNTLISTEKNIYSMTIWNDKVIVYLILELDLIESEIIFCICTKLLINNK